MDINDYLIDPSGIDWKEMLSDWFWLLPDHFTPWLVNRFGDIFLVYEDGSVHLFDTGSAQISKLADNRDHFCDLIDANANNWLMIPLVDVLVEKGMKLKNRECYSFITPPGLSGKYEPENVKVYDMSVHYSVHGQIFEKVKDLPDGTQFKFEIKEAEQFN